MIVFRSVCKATHVMSTLRQMFSSQWRAWTSHAARTTPQTDEDECGGGAAEVNVEGEGAAGGVSVINHHHVDHSPDTRKRPRTDASVTVIRMDDSSYFPADKSKPDESPDLSIPSHYPTTTLHNIPSAVPSAAAVCHVMAHMWYRMLRHQQETAGYIITDAAVWMSMLNDVRRPISQRDATSAMAATLLYGPSHTHDLLAFGRDRALQVHNTMAVAAADDDDRWTSTFWHMTHRSHSGRSHSTATVCSSDFATSIDAVCGLMVTMVDARNYFDPSLWLVAMALGRRLHTRYVEWCAQHPDKFPPFQFVRMHELRILATLFGLALKQQSDYYIRTKDTHSILPSTITTVAAVRDGAVSGSSTATTACLPQSLRSKYPHIAQRVERSILADVRASGGAPCKTPPFSLQAAARLECAVLVDGLGYHTLVQWEDILAMMSEYASPNELHTVLRYVKATR